MGSKERREREKAELRDKILDAARAMFIEEGYAAVTMRSLAKRIEYSPAAIYLHFKDKESLLMELCSTDLGEMTTALAAIADASSPIERLHTVAVGYVRFAQAHPAQYQLVFLVTKPDVAAQLEAAGEPPDRPERASYLVLRRHFEELIKLGLVRRDVADADLLAQTYFSALHGIVATAICMNASECAALGWRDAETQARYFVDLFLTGIRP
jgi:AcrR family transcriptional regulator